MAIESPHVTATTIEATEFPDLVRRYRVSGVPKIVVDETIEILGAEPEDQFVRHALASRLRTPSGT
jgi:predicted DsbA family dithiol-disulfide isomerase